MKMKSVTFVGCLTAALSVLPAVALAASPSETNALGLLKSLRAQAVDTRNSATDLETVDRVANPSWETNSVKLDELRIAINAMGRTFAQLEQVRDSAAPFEQKAIDEAAPLLKEMADNIDAAIRYLNNNRAPLWEKGYREHIVKLATESIQLDKTLGQFIKFAKVHAQDNQLERALGVASGS